MKNIGRTYKPTDLAARAGITAVVGAIFLCLLLSFAPNTYGTSLPGAVVNSSSDLQIALRWIQPLLGYAIVEDAVIRQPLDGRLSKAIDGVDQMPVVAHHKTAAVNSETWTSVHLTATKMDHVSRVQWIMGRLIVELTRHRLVASDEPADEGNQRIIAIARLVEKELNGAFRTGSNAGPGRPVATHALHRELAPSHNPEAGLVF